MVHSSAKQLSLWPDATYDDNRTRNLRPPRPDCAVYLQTQQWRCRRAEVIQRQKFKCWRCGIEKRLSVHHLSYDRLGDEEPSDLVALCRSCHTAVHQDEQEARRLFKPCAVR
jgi:hypothetical protein